MEERSDWEKCIAFPQQIGPVEDNPAIKGSVLMLASSKVWTLCLIAQLSLVPFELSVMFG